MEPERHEVFSPRQLAPQALAILGHAAESKGLALGHEVAPEVPAALRGDARRLLQILLNLVGNAVKYTLQGSVTLRLGYAEGRLDCEVEDTGVGISAADLERLFLPFQRADTTVARNVEGSGLGLAICHHLVTEMGGTIGCRSERDRRGPGSGSTFWFRVPLPEAEQTELPAESEERTMPFAGRRILVVDNDAVHRLVLVSHLEDLGGQVTEAAGGRQALDLMADATFGVDAVFVDVQMPEIDGCETIRRLRAAWSQEEPAVVIAVTAEATAEVRARCLGAGADGLLAKPFRRAELAAQLIGRLPDRPTTSDPETGSKVPAPEVPASLAESET